MEQTTSGTKVKRMTSIELGQYHEEILNRILTGNKGMGTKVEVLRRALELLQDKVFGDKT